MPALVFDDEHYPSLSYNLVEDSVYCVECVAFSSAKVILISNKISSELLPF